MQRQPAFPIRQRGLSMFGFLFTAFVLVMLAVLAMKVVPAYIEYFSVKKILAAMETEGYQDKSNIEIRKDFDRRSNVDYVTVIKGADLVITRERGATLVSAEYEFRTKLFGHASLVIDFNTAPQSEPAVE